MKPRLRESNHEDEIQVPHDALPQEKLESKTDTKADSAEGCAQTWLNMDNTKHAS